MKASLSLTQAIDLYLRSRRPLGFALKNEEPLLRSLARYAQQVCHHGPLTEELVLQWACLPKEAAPLWWARRLLSARRLARFWRAFDPRVQVPSPGVFGSAYGRSQVHNRLLAWQRRGDETVSQKILALATYLGHRNIRHTYWYLSAIPELLVLASRRLAHSQIKEGAR